MLEIVRTKFRIPIHEVFFSDDADSFSQTPFLSFFIQALKPATGFYPFKTSVIDLRESTAVIFSKISNGARYKIKRAEREQIKAEFETSPSQKQIFDFQSFFDTFAKQKSLTLSNGEKLRALSSNGSLIISSAKDDKGEVLVQHAYVADRSIGRLRLLYSASHFRGSEDSELRNKIGRSNRLLHWFEIQKARDTGFESYDLGGIPINDNDPEKNSIARFKREFGGNEITEYNGFKSVTPFISRAIPIIRALIS